MSDKPATTSTPQAKSPDQIAVPTPFEETYWNAHTELLKVSGFPAMNGTQLDRLRVGAMKMVRVLRNEIRSQTTDICRRLQLATIDAFDRVKADTNEIKEKLDSLEKENKELRRKLEELDNRTIGSVEVK